MSEAKSAASGNTLDLNSSSQTPGDASEFVFSAVSTPSGSGGLLLRPILPPKSALKGHQRSASHGGVATRPLVTGGISGAGSAGIVSRPSALKTPGHQRAFSQGQILDSPNSGGLSRSGHSRVGSRTDFILPPGHKEGGGSGTPGSAASLFKPGHKRQASRSESIYTLRQGKKPNLFTRCCNFILRKQYESDPSDNKQRIVVPNHLVPSVTNKKDHPNSRWANNYVCTTKYTLLSFIPKNLFEQFHRVANLYFIFIVLLNWFPAINAFGKEISMIPVLFVLGVTAIKDLFEDRRRHISDKRINNSTCRIYDGHQGRYKKVLWKHVRVGDVIHLSNNELIPADVLLLRSSEPHGICYIDTCNLDGETNLKQRTVVRGFTEKQQLFDPKHFDSLIEVDAPSTKIYKFHGSLIHPSGERVPLSTDNLLLRECMVKNTDFVEGIVVYAGHETKALLNNGGPRYKRSGIERQMNRDIIWCVLILLVLCVVGAIGCRMWLFSYEIPVPFIPVAQEPNYEGFLTFFTFIIILQVMIPLSLYVSVEMTKLLQIYHIHNDSAFFDPETNKRIECRALNITEELGQVQYIFSDKTGTLTENKMIFRRLSANGVDYSHASPSNEQRSQIRPGAPMPVIINSKLQEDLSYIHNVNNLKKPNETFTPSPDCRKKEPNAEGDVSGKVRHAQVLQELLLVLAICNTVVVSKHPHHDVMNASGLIETVLNYNKTPSRKIIETIEAEASVPESEPVRNSNHGQLLKKKFSNPVLSSEKIVLSSRSNSDLGLKTNLKNFPLHKSKSLENDKSHDRYSRLCESRSVTPSPPLPQVPLLQFPKNNGNANEKTEPPPSLGGGGGGGYPINGAGISKSERPRLLNIPGLLFIGKKSKSNFQARSKTPSPSELKPIFEAESPDELALVEAAHSYNCRLLKRTPVSASVVVPGEGLMDFEILKVLPFDATRKMMSVIVRHPKTKQIILYCKGADTTIFSNLAFTDNLEVQQNIFSTQQQINSYARQGLRVLVMAKRYLSETEYAEWSNAHKKIELSQENREKKLLESFCSIETKLTLLGATGTEDRLQDGVPECIAELMSAGIIIWVLTGDKPETAINIAYSARLFSPQMEPLTLSARNKAAAESAINFYLSDIKGQNPVSNNLPIDGRGVFGRGDENSSRPEPLRSRRKRVLVVDGKTLTFILDPKSKLQKPFLELTGHCSSVLCCRATPLQKAYIVKIVKEILHKKTLAIGDGANDVSMIQTADVGVGISGQEGMQAIMASDYALSRFKFLEKLLLVHGHWCYDRIARMVLYFFYKNATFVFLIFWYQLYCGYSAQVMIDQMHLMLYNLLFTSLPPLAIGVYEQDAPEELLMANPSLYSQGRLGHVYQPHSFWITMADSLYQAIVIFFITLGAYHDSDIGLWEFGTTITTSCLFIMLAHVAIETKSWTVIHVISIFASIFLFFSFSLLYNGLCVDCLGLPSNYWVMQMVIVTPVFWLVIVLTAVLALLPRFLYICYSRWLSPHEVARAVRDRKTHVARGEEFLASWSRSTSTSSIYRTLDTSLKGTQNNALTSIFTLLGGQTNPYPSDVNVNWLIDRLGTAMPSAGNSTSTTPANIPSNEECGIRDVWAHNLDEEFKTIRQIVQKYHWIAMDTEFPGVVARPLGEFRTNADYQYRLLKLNVDLLRIIQLGLTFLDENGKTPGGQYTTWQFNFKFNLSEDMYAQDSIDLLQNSGIQFKKHEEEGIEPLYFAELLMTSGIVLMDNIKWLSFHSCYDFGYLIKLLTDSNLPEEEAEFFDLLKIFFPTVYDVKYLMRSCKFLKGGLQEVADQLELLRIGPQHQAGSDSLLTGMAFFKMKEMYFEDNIDESKYSGHLCNLGNSFFVNGSGMNIPPGGFHDNGDTSTS